MPETPDIDALIEQLPADQRPLVSLIVELLREQNQVQAEQNRVLTEQVAKLTHEASELRRMLFGRRAEKKQPDARRKARGRAQAKKSDALKAKERKAARAVNAAELQALPVVDEVLDIPVPERVCTACGSTDMAPLGQGLVTEQLEYVPAQIVRRRFTRRRYACACGSCILTAPPPPQVTEGAKYGPALHAHVATSKCADALPLYRQAQRFKRAGAPIARATLCALFHRAADQVDPIHARILEHIAASSHVAADETPLPVLAEGGCKRGYVWTWVTRQAVAYSYSATRSSATPRRLLEGSSGVLQVDGYSGYNAVTGPDGRVRAGCWAHVRRQFFRSLDTAGEDAGAAMDRISLLYDVEHRVAEAGVTGTATHRQLRQEETAPVVDAFFPWLVELQSVHPPKSPMGKAIRYALRQETALRQFLADPRVALDNNAAERALKPVALGRKNFLFAGHDEGAKNLAKLQTVVATCQLHGINVQDYLTDVLVRVNEHPARRLDELLPWNWALGKT